MNEGGGDVGLKNAMGFSVGLLRRMNLPQNGLDVVLVRTRSEQGGNTAATGPYKLIQSLPLRLGSLIVLQPFYMELTITTVLCMRRNVARLCES